MKIGDREFKAGALNFKAIRRVMPYLNGQKELRASMDVLDLMKDIIATSIKRGGCNEDLTDFLEEELDFGNMPIIVAEIMAASGVDQSKPGEPTPVATGQTTTG